MNLNENFNQQEFINWISDFLPDFTKEIRKVDVSKSFQGIKSIQTIGESSLGVRVYIIESDQDPSKRKIGLTTESFTLLRDYGTPNALIAYYSENSSLWRLSLLTSNLTWDEGKIKKKLSNPKRQSYVLGPKAKVKTPHQYLLSKGNVTDFSDLKSRFSLEVVNKEFYKEISSAFINLVGGQLINGKSKKTVEAQLKLPFINDHSQTTQEFAVRLIGRIIFCWFLREKRSSSGHSLMPKELLSYEASNTIDDYYHKILEPIFFEVLNKKVPRKDAYSNELFSAIPYLNGGLFSPHDDDFFSYNEGRQAINHNTVIVPDSWLKSLFEVLETFNFTIDENTSFDEELSIDPEMLGRIFENLLAEINPETGESARKSTGSYYTPRVIVDYMVDESLFLYLKDKTAVDEGKLRALISYDLDDDGTNPLAKEEKDKIAQALGTIKILDPACGSGAFPIGALQKIVFILQQIDPQGQLWFKRQIEKTPSIMLKRVIEREFRENNFDYIRKLGIIQDNIFGVDIQPIATEISRLRCFLTLVVDERIDDTLENRGVEPLPNLDFKFVTANTLVNLPTFNNQQSELFDDHSKIEKLKELIQQYFNARDEERKDVMIAFGELQSEMINELIDKYSFTGAVKAELTRKLTDWKPFKHRTTDWFDPEWMFGVKDGFDIVIANPPYVDSESMTKNHPEARDLYKDSYKTTRGNWDLFVPFIENGFNILHESGHLAFIIPNKLIAAKYTSTLRDFLVKKTICEIRDYSRLSVFSEANVYPVTLIAKNSQTTKEYFSSFIVMSDLKNIKSKNICSSKVISQNIYWDLFFYDELTYKILNKILSNKTLKSIGVSLLGSATVGEAYELKKVIKNFDGEKHIKKVINTGTIDKYKSLWGIQEMQYIKGKYLTPIVNEIDIQKINPIRLEQANSKKLIIAGMSKNIEAYLDNNGEYLAGKSTLILLGNHEVLCTLIGILNSTLMDFFVSRYFNSLKMSGGYLNISKEILENIPVCVEKDKNIVYLVSLMNQTYSREVEKNINDLVFKLYDINGEEIKFIERSLI